MQLISQEQTRGDCVVNLDQLVTRVQGMLESGLLPNTSTSDFDYDRLSKLSGGVVALASWRKRES